MDKQIDKTTKNVNWSTIFALPPAYVTSVRHNDSFSMKRHVQPFKMKKVNKQCLLDTPRTVRVSEKNLASYGSIKKTLVLIRRFQ